MVLLNALFLLSLNPCLIIGFICDLSVDRNDWLIDDHENMPI